MKVRKWLISIFSTAFFVFGVYMMQLASVKIIRLEKSFTFLTIQTDGVEACITQVKLDGGAGFLLKTNNGEKVALAVYLKEENAILVKERLSKNYGFLQIEKISPSALYFKGLKQKQRADTVQGAFVNFYTMIERLDRVIQHLLSSGTQESCKRELSAMSSCFSTFSKSYEGVFDEFSKISKEAEKSLNKSIEGICLVKDLRYLLCEWCIEYVALSNQFAL